jgi:DNA topoisomerase-1
MAEFWQPFKERVDEKETSVSRKDAARARDLGTDPGSGRPVSVRMGQYGAYAQLGLAEDEEKPKFAGLLPGQRIDEVTLEDAMQLFKLPRELGESPDGDAVVAGIGRFGPYVKYGRKYVSLPKEDDPYTVNLDRALQLIQEKQRSEAPLHTWEHDGKTIVVRNGRYGPYATDGEVNASIPKKEDPGSVTLARVLELLEAKRNAPKRKGPPRRGRPRSAAGSA